MRTCDLAGCDRPHKARGMCRMHYDRACSRGDVSALPCVACVVGEPCGRHHPTVCVCVEPLDSPMWGQCGRCRRVWRVSRPDLAERLPAVRDAWRAFLADEGVLGLVVEVGR